MTESLRGPFGWLRHWLGRHRTPPTPLAGEAVTTTGSRALRKIETRLGADIVEAERGGPASASAQLAVALGRAMTGRRVAIFGPADALAAELDQLRAILERRVPLVLHVNVGGPAPPGAGAGGRLLDVHAAAELGCPVAVARNAQEALDLTLIARRLAEETLTPVVLAVEGPEIAAGPGRLVMPTDELLSELVGSAGDEVECGNESERTLFGASRRRVPRWLDPASPVAVGAVRTGLDRGLSDLGRSLLRGRDGGARLRTALNELAGRTGRPLDPVWTYRTKDARVVLVAQGALLETARVVIDHLRAARQLVGLVGVSWLRPLDGDALGTALQKSSRVAVLEGPGDDAPLSRLVRASLAGHDPTMVGVAAGAAGLPVRAGEIAALAERLLTGGDPPERLLLGVSDRATSAFPRREALVQAARRALPDLRSATLGECPALDLRPAGSRTVTWWGAPAERATAALTRLADRLGESGRPAVQTRWREAADHVWSARLTAAEAPFGDPGDETAVDVAVLAELPDVAWLDPLADVVEGGTVVIPRVPGAGEEVPGAGEEVPGAGEEVPGAGEEVPGAGEEVPGAAEKVASTDEGDEVESGWAVPALPAAWIETIRAKGLRVIGVSGQQTAVADAVVWLLEGGDDEAPEGVGLVDAAVLEPRAAALADDQDVPAVVRRRRAQRERYDNLPRFWGGLVQPRVLGEAPQPLPDPLVTLGVVPANAASLFDRTPEREALPRFEAARCTGCSRCWVSCPDGALGPVALSTQSWLEAGLDRAAEGSSQRDPAVDKLRRALPQLSKRLDGQVAKGDAPVLAAETVGEAFDWLTEKMKPSDEEREGMSTGLRRALGELAPLEAVVTDALFRAPHREQSGSGALLMLAVDSHACQGCGVCAAECPEDALEMVPQTAAAVDAVRAGWRLWEAVPDTSGSVVDRARKREEIGGLGGILLSRHVASSVCGADGAEPGSGERLGVRQVVAVVEFERQRAMQTAIARLMTLGDSVKAAIREQMGDAIGAADLSHLDEALQRTAGARVKLADVLAGLEAQGDRAIVDQPLLAQRVESARAVDDARRSLSEGREGLGWARYAVVIDRATAEAWAARFPRNPFGSPVAVAADSDAASLALGVAEGLAARWVGISRAMRLADLAAKAPSAAKVRAEAESLASLEWSNMTDDERASCPPVVVVAAAESLVNDDLGALSRLLRAPLPLLLVLTDGRGSAEAVDPALFALSHRDSFVLATSVAHPDHLFAGVAAALEAGRPALIHVYSPSPGRHGFPPAETLARARRGVEARVHPLLRYDPRATGVFGTRLALDANPEPDTEWVTGEDGKAITPADWASGEERFGDSVDDLVAVSAHRWRLLQELAGVVTPFTERVRAEVTEALEAEKRSEIDALVAEYETRMAQREASQKAAQAGELRNRLLALAGYDPARLRAEEEN